MGRDIGPRDFERRVIVCGSRDCTDWEGVYAALDRIHAAQPISIVIHGNARGVDRIAGVWARTRGLKELPVPAEWSKYGKAAGPRRNAKMLGLQPARVIAFPGGAGTRDMVKRALAAGVEIIEAANA